MDNISQRRKGYNIFPGREKRRSYRDTRSVKRGLIVVFIIAAAATGILLHFSVSGNLSGLFRKESASAGRVDRYRDLNAVHLKFAVLNGITPFKTDKAFNDGVGELTRKKKLVKIDDNRYYVVRKLSHSHPYLTPKASDLLDDIGKRFRKKLEEKGKPPYCFQVSSLLRTGESQRRLGKLNRNAAQVSSHFYGTTFDITYKSLIKKPFPWIRSEISDGEGIALLSAAIGELRREGRCKVVTEYRERCFHITVVK